MSRNDSYPVKIFSIKIKRLADKVLGLIIVKRSILVKIGDSRMKQKILLSISACRESSEGFLPLAPNIGSCE